MPNASHVIICQIHFRDTRANHVNKNLEALFPEGDGETDNQMQGNEMRNLCWCYGENKTKR